MSDYATTEQIRAFAQQPDSLAGGADGSNWELLATAASRIFDNLAEVSDSFFAQTNDAFAYRYFVGDGTAYLRLDPYTTINPTTPVHINEGTITDTDYEVGNVPEYIEKDGMLIVLDKTNQNFSRVMPEFDRFTGWPNGKQIRVSAKWGFSAIPSDITFAVIQIALQMFRTGDPATAVLSNTEKAVSQELPQIALDTASKYREKYGQRAVFA